MIVANGIELIKFAFIHWIYQVGVKATLEIRWQ